MAKAHSPRNSLLASGVWRRSRSTIYAKKALWKRNKKPVCKADKPARDLKAFKTVEVKGEKNGSQRKVALHKAPRWYPTEAIRRPLKTHKAARPTKLRSSITPGTILILLAGRFRGKRVVFLKQLASGLLLVTGPYKVNGVPLRRVNQAYVIATSTKVDLTGCGIDAKFNDDYFKREKAKKKKGTEAEFFNDAAKKTPCPEGKAADQKTVDAGVLAAIAKVPQLRSYLNASFSLTNKQAPHAMKF